MDEMALLLTGWNGHMGGDSVAAAVYSYIRYFQAKSLLDAMDDVGRNDRLWHTRGMMSPHYVELSVRIITNASENGTHFNPICRQKGRQYKKENICAYNIASAFVNTKRHMAERYGNDTNQWKFGDMIGTKYDHDIWSKSPAKDWIDVWVNVPGNHATIKIAEWGLNTDIETKKPYAFKAGKLTEFTFIATMEEGNITPSENFFCVNSGLNEFFL